MARAKGATLERDMVTRTLSSIEESPPHLKPSMQRNVECGRTCKLEPMVGIVVKLGMELGVSTPAMRFRLCDPEIWTMEGAGAGCGLI